MNSPPPQGAALSAAFVGALLNALDKYQARSLNWGFFDLTMSEDEIVVLQSELADSYAMEWEVLRDVHGYTVGLLASNPLRPTTFTPIQPDTVVIELGLPKA